MNVLVACERSQRVAAAFRSKGHNAFSCDIVSTFGNPSFHLLGDIFDFIDGGVLFSQDHNAHVIPSWDMLIGFPPCTYLTKAATSLHSLSRVSDDFILDRTFKRLSAIEFFLRLYDCSIPCIALENPIGVLSTVFRKPDQIIHPYYFCAPGDPEYVTKATCLWLRNLPLLSFDPPGPLPDLGFRPNGKRRNFVESKSTAEERFITFHCVASAMAEQWG